MRVKTFLADPLLRDLLGKRDRWFRLVYYSRSTEASMTPYSDFLNIASDPVFAALGGLTLEPVLISSAIIGLWPSKSLPVILRALIAVGAAQMIQALTPLSYGLPPVWPDVFSVTFGISSLMMFVPSFVIISVLGLIRQSIASMTSQTKAAKTKSETSENKAAKA